MPDKVDGNPGDPTWRPLAEDQVDLDWHVTSASLPEPAGPNELGQMLRDMGRSRMPADRSPPSSPPRLLSSPAAVFPCARPRLRLHLLQTALALHRHTQL